MSWPVVVEECGGDKPCKRCGRAGQIRLASYVVWADDSVTLFDFACTTHLADSVIAVGEAAE